MGLSDRDVDDRAHVRRRTGRGTLTGAGQSRLGRRPSRSNNSRIAHHPSGVGIIVRRRSVQGVTEVTVIVAITTAAGGCDSVTLG